MGDRSKQGSAGCAAAGPVPRSDKQRKGGQMGWVTNGVMAVSVMVACQPGPVLQQGWVCCSGKGCISTQFSLDTNFCSALRTEADFLGVNLAAVLSACV